MTPSTLDLHRIGRATAAGALAALCLFPLAASPASAAPAAAGRTERVSVSGSGRQAAAGSQSDFSISGTGRYVAFVSASTDLVPRDTNGVADVFVRDRRAGTTKRVSVSAAGAQADAASWGVTISDDGRFVAFVSSATDLVPGDTNGYSDIFVRDLRTGATRRIDTGTEQYNATLSGNGRQLAYSTTAGDADEQEDVYVRDLTTGATSRISVPSTAAPADGGSFWQSISTTGRYVAFASFATNLVPGDTNENIDVFLRDRVAGTTTRVSLTDDDQQAAGRSQAPSVSADGRLVAFDSENALVPADTTGNSDIYLRDVRLGTTTLISSTPAGGPGGDNSSDPDLSADGTRVVFGSWSADLVAGDTNSWFDIFDRDLRTGVTTRASVSTGGAEGDLPSSNGRISGDGRHVAFDSEATTLVPGDTNDSTDIFVRDAG